MKFTKMHGAGNDYVYVNCFEETVNNPASLAKIISDRHYGIGSDGLILIRPSSQADFFMEMFNADGSRSAMCGNGIRCVGKYVYDHGLTDKTVITVNTQAGVKRLSLNVQDGRVSSVTVDMGCPVLDAGLVPVVADESPVIAAPIQVAGRQFAMTCVSMGNPHAVVFVDDTASFPVAQIGPHFETHTAFPERVNAEFVQVLGRGEINMRVWERGTGETLACGTGTCASVVACILNGLTDDTVIAHLLGGDLVIRWDCESGHVFMTGPAVTVFEGVFAEDACPKDEPPHVVDPNW